MGIGVGIRLVEHGLLPDWVIRRGIRRLLKQRLREQTEGSESDREQRFRKLLGSLSEGSLATHMEEANEQHYEIPAGFFKCVLGPHLKYSSCYWPEGVESLGSAESAMLELTCRRAGLEDGMEILELGCGWGSLSLWAARKYPSSRILAMSNSHSQRALIQAKRDQLGLTNLEVITRDINDLRLSRQFDRVISVEMFEHLLNYQTLLRKIAGWLKPAGRLFVHVFSHRRFPYRFQSESVDDWMGRYFFAGGLMPSHRIFEHFQDDLQLEESWWLEGTHYRKTASSWLQNLDQHRDEARVILGSVYGTDQAPLWQTRWRIFFMACEELFGFKNGNEWGVSHYLFSKRLDTVD